MRRDTKITLLILGVVVLVTSVVTIRSQLNHPAEEPEVTESVQRVTAGTYTNLSGEIVSLEPAAHTLTVVVSWATWCPSCTEELQKAIALAETFATSGVQVIALNRAEPAVRIEQYLRSIGLTAEDTSVSFMLDPADHLFASVEGYTVPETVVMTPDESILTHIHGPMDEANVRDIITRVLSQ